MHLCTNLPYALFFLIKQFYPFSFVRIPVSALPRHEMRRAPFFAEPVGFSGVIAED